MCLVKNKNTRAGTASVSAFQDAFQRDISLPSAKSTSIFMTQARKPLSGRAARARGHRTVPSGAIVYRVGIALTR